jgi:hypothetical protein
MSIRPGIIIGIVAVFAFLFGGQYLGWFGSKDKAGAVSNAISQGSAPVSPTRVATSTPPPDDSAAKPQTPPLPATRSNRTALVSVPPKTAPEVGEIADWEQRIDDVLTAEGEENIKARQLLEILPKLPEDGQVEAAQHISNLLPDEEYGSLAPTLTNPLTSESVLDVLMTDVLNRPNAIKLDTLLDVARAPNHPKGEEARDVLEVYTDQNCGVDWDCWKSAIDKYKVENPDE